MHAQTEQEIIADQFEIFWWRYPSRGGHTNSKGNARERFITAVEEGADPEQLILAAQNYAIYVQSQNIAGQFVKQADQWITSEFWRRYTFEPGSPA